ncbi:MAG TPA: hypothetical protein VFG07_02405, partial [Thermoplasmata archaeon]|nr:hypothetical protein [Thermoplasmata archaeon]
MRLLPGLAFAVLVGALLLSSLFAGPAALPSPRVIPGAPSGSVLSHGPSTAGAATSAAASPLAASSPQSGCIRPTPTGTPNWNSPNFFADALVTFYVPGSPTLDGSNFQAAPCNNVIPTYTNGFWMNVTTNVPLIAANVTIWGTSWPTPGNSAPPIPNFAPTAPVRVLPMFIQPPYYHSATFFFDVYRFFWPGSQVYFNVTLESVGATPPTVRSTQSAYSVPINYPGGTNNATWEFYVADPWGAGQFQQDDANFSQVVQVTTTPSVLSTPAFDPNPSQALDITLTSVNPSGGPANPIPMAQGNISLTGGRVGQALFAVAFGPSNHSVMHLTLPLGPYPGSEVQFTITAWLPWSLSTNGQVGAIDRIYSPVFKFNWSAQGGWWYPTYGLLGNSVLTSLPDVTSLGGATSTLPTGTPVNISVHSPIENVTISTASVAYRYSDANGVSTGTIPMGFANANTTYLTLPGLPPASTMVFSVTAKDVYGNPISSGNFTYTETGALSPPLAGGYGLFFAEAIDLSTGTLVRNVNYSISNSTWSETGVGRVFGFVAP